MRRNPSCLAAACALLVALVAGVPATLPAASMPGAQSAPSGGARIALALQRQRLLRADERQAQRADLRLGAARVIAGAELRRLNPEPGELLSVTEKRFRALEFDVSDTPGVKAKKVKSTFVARGVAYDSTSGLLAIAAVSKVLLLEVSKTRDNLSELTAPGDLAESFEFANDVLFDGKGSLIIVDQGSVLGGREVADGRVWRYELASGEFSPLAASKELFNPKLLARDSAGNVYFVDGEAGPLISPLFPDRWDKVWRISGKNLTKAKPVWSRAGVQATAFDIDAAGRYWLANLAELVIIVDGTLRQPCGVPLPFEFVTGLVTDKNGTAFVLDGAGVKTAGRWLYGVTITCVTNEILFGSKLKGARGLARVDAAGS